MPGAIEVQVRAMHSRVEKNLRFAIARGLTNTAKFAAEKLGQQLPTIFDRPTPFTQRAIGITSATKATMQATVFVRNAQAQYLTMQEQGGIRAPRPGSPINIPVAQRINQYGNISRGAIARQKQKCSVFVANGKGKTKHLPPGLYERLGNRKTKGLGSRRGAKVTTGRGKQKTRVKLLVAFERQAKYQPRFRFQERTIKIAQANVRSIIEASIRDAMATMR